MFDGLWTVEFISTINQYGSGVLIVNGDKLLGGDDGYYYSGTWTIRGNTIEATIAVLKHNPNSISVFGNIDHFQLNLIGEIDEYQFNATGTIVNNPQAQIKVVGTKREDL
ncbi:MAG: hypothetical protein KKB23_04205 [Proteobacteria bacterium]|nr:hypothetical protein [Pseudomonadota bacterium]